MKLRKLLSLMLVLVLAVTMFSACGEKKAPEEPVAEAPAADGDKPAEEPAPAETEAKDSYKVYLITMDQMDQHWVNVDAGAKKAVEELGNVNYKWIAPDVKDDAKQIEMVNTAIADGADAIIIAANGPDAITAVLSEAEAEGIKIVYIDSPANFPAVQTLATDNKAAGLTAGKEMLAGLEEAGITEGKIGILNTNAASISTLDRVEGFTSAFEGTAFEVLEPQYTEGDISKSKDAAANFISQGAVGVFGANEGTTVGTGNAIQEAEGTVIGVGFDKSDMILSLVKDGSLRCTMVQNPDVMGYEGVKTAVKALSGEDVGEDYVDTGVSVVNKDNVDTVA